MKRAKPMLLKYKDSDALYSSELDKSAITYTIKVLSMPVKHKQLSTSFVSQKKMKVCLVCHKNKNLLSKDFGATAKHNGHILLKVSFEKHI